MAWLRRPVPAIATGVTAVAVVVSVVVVLHARTTTGAGGGPPDHPGDPTIAAAGDIACGPTDSLVAASNDGDGQPEVSVCKQQAVSDLVARLGVSAVLPLGDNQYPVGRYASYLRYYAPSWGRFKAITHPVPGNHEYYSSDAGGYFRYFGAAAGDETRGYYSYNLGSWHLIALNAECDYVGGCGAGSAQERWLAADLRSHPASCTLAYWHQPRFSSGQHGDDPAYAAFWKDLAAAHADVVLNGHEHDYERFGPQDPAGRPDPAGIREFVVGTGGKSHYHFTSVRPNSEVRDSAASGVLVLRLGATGYRWQFASIPGSSLRDAGHAQCH